MTLVGYGPAVETRDIYIGAEGATSRKATIAAGQLLARGAVLGRIAWSDEFMLATTTATNGSDVPVAILAAPIDTRGGAAPGLIFETGRFVAGALTFGAGHTAATVRDPLRDVGIVLMTSTGP